jgi:tetratricopeptide (TPR) repeat protein
MLQRQAAVARLADEQLATAPDSVATVRILIEAKNLDGLLVVLRRIVDTHPRRIPDAFASAGEASWQFRGDEAAERARAETLRGILADARRRLPEIPREEAARAERLFVNLDGLFGNRGSRDEWRTRLTRFVEEYKGTEAALFAEVDLISSLPVSQQMFDALDAFIAAHPGSIAAAKALFQKGFQLHTINTLGRLYPRGADPTDRFIRVEAIVSELESGKFPPSEWVDQAPSLITGFFLPRDAKIAEDNIDRLIHAHEEFVRRELVRNPEKALHPEHPAGNGLGYIITGKIADLYARKGQRVEGVERVLASLERQATDPSGIRYLRALFYLQPHEGQSDEQRKLLIEKARAELAAIAAAGSGLYHRKALASLANLEYRQRSFTEARDAYRRYADSYPASEWAWVALVRAGICHEALGDIDAAANMYLRAAKYPDSSIAHVLGHAYAARVFEEQGEIQRALEEHQRALEQWDTSLGPRLGTYAPQPLSSNPFDMAADRHEVLRETLSGRIARLELSMQLQGGAELERGRALLSRGRIEDAAATLKGILEKHPKSPAASEARALAHRARLEQALRLAEAERPDRDEEAAIRELEALSREPLDFAVVAARIARASLYWVKGDWQNAESGLLDALNAWHARQAIGKPETDLEKDVAEIRRAVFLPSGGPIYSSGRWNAFSWPNPAPPFMLVNSDVRVKLSNGEIERMSLLQEFSTSAKVIFFDTEQIALLETMVSRLGGTKRRQPGHIMETPNQPVGDSRQILRLWARYFPARPGHWGGWELETYPVITEIQFADSARTKASALVTIGYSGATVELEKEGERWIPRRLTGQWIT